MLFWKVMRKFSYLLSQIINSTFRAAWVIEEDIQRLRWSALSHPSWSFQWTPREANSMAHKLAKWCSQAHIFGVLDVADIPLDILNWDSCV